VRPAVAAMLLVWSAGAQPVPTAVYTLSDYHTTRWTTEPDPVSKIAGVCRVAPGPAHPVLACSAPPAGVPRQGGRYFYSVVLFRDLEENLYLATCAATARDARCGELRAGQTFTAEVEDRTIRIVVGDEQVPLRILDLRPKPATIDSPTPGTPSQVRPSTGSPSSPSWSKASDSPGAPSSAQPSSVSISAGAPSQVTHSEASTPLVSPTSGRLIVYCRVGSARVWVDNLLIGQPPAEAPVLPGRHTVRVQAAGFRVWTRTVEVPRGGVARVVADLR